MHLFFKLLTMAAMVTQPGSQATTGGRQMEARGTFEVKVVPAETTAFEKAMGISRYELDKVWAGDFTGTSKGEMLSTFTESTGLMAYVAVEKMTGALGGKSGSVLLAHRATMTKGDAGSGEMHVAIVKGSGTGELRGITGELTIDIDAAGKHSYVLRYDMP